MDRKARKNLVSEYATASWSELKTRGGLGPVSCARSWSCSQPRRKAPKPDAALNESSS